ncbi:MAG: PilZ domain-containing protein [Treponema sp.]|jgi:hypothetical protein|nr:PilZ domain-containing protein [Treponema sp.]
MIEKRKFVRYATSARVRVNAYTEALVLLRDISRHGCCISYPYTLSASGFDLEMNNEYALEIFPEPDVAGRFKLIIQPCWTRIKDGMYETGCYIVQFPTQEDRENFTAYLAWQSCRK